MKYQKITTAKFLSRPNRFIAKVELDDATNAGGRIETVHVKNTGRCKELLVPGCTVFLEDFKDRMGSRKMRYSLVAVRKERFKENSALLINMDSQAPNIVVKEALQSGVIKIPVLGRLTKIQPETTYGNSRFDFYLEGSKGKGFLEVKGCTLEENNIASFPDAPTERGVKHIEELIEAKRNGYYAGILFVIQMEGMKYIRPNDETHPAFGEALRKAATAGVETLAYECCVTEDSLTVSKKSKVKL